MRAPKTAKMVKVSGKADSSYPNGAIIEGPEWVDPKIGERYRLDGYIKTSLNERFHWFSTTPVRGVTISDDGSKTIETGNSVWRITYAG